MSRLDISNIKALRRLVEREIQKKKTRRWEITDSSGYSTGTQQFANFFYDPGEGVEPIDMTIKTPEISSTGFLWDSMKDYATLHVKGKPTKDIRTEKDIIDGVADALRALPNGIVGSTNAARATLWARLHELACEAERLTINQ